MKREYKDPATGVTKKIPKITKALIAANANNGPGLYNLGTYELHSKNFDNAKKLFKMSLNCEKTPETLLNMSTCYKLTNDHITAYKLLGECMEKFPNFPLAYNNSGLIDYDYRRLDIAIEKYLKALALKPDYADAHWNYALALYLKFFNKINAVAYSSEEVNLLKPEFDETLSHFNWRFRKSNPVRIAYHPGTVWEGQELKDNEQIMLLSEQGYGDIIQFMRYAYYFPPGKAILHIPEDTHCLVRPGYTCTINSTEPFTRYYIPMMSAAQYFPFSGEKYITHDKTATLDGDYKIGIVWKGNRSHANDRNRSMQYKDFYWLFKHGTVYSLQKDKETVKAKDIHDLKINSWTDTMSYINAMDVVVTIDSAVAHLCGAMGKDCIVLIPSIGIDWRWGEFGDRTVWYNSLRLARNRSQSEAERLLLEIKEKQQ